MSEGILHYIVEARWIRFREGAAIPETSRVFLYKRPTHDEAFAAARQEIDRPGLFFSILSVEVDEVRTNRVDEWSY